MMSPHSLLDACLFSPPDTRSRTGRPFGRNLDQAAPGLAYAEE